jgi:hypothetical protein
MHLVAKVHIGADRKQWFIAKPSKLSHCFQPESVARRKASIYPHVCEPRQLRMFADPQLTGVQASRQ